jgi:hypothetical protein
VAVCPRCKRNVPVVHRGGVFAFSDHPGEFHNSRGPDAKLPWCTGSGLEIHLR